MVVPNTSKRFLWAYEAIAGTPDNMDQAGDQTYYFGVYNEDVKKWNYPKIINTISSYMTYNTRDPSLVDNGASLPSFTHTYIPTSAQHLVWQKGKCTIGVGDIHTFGSADYNKDQYAISIRNEQSGGDNPQFQQLNGCFSTKLYGQIQAGSPYTVEQTWEFMNFEDDTGGKAFITQAPVDAATFNTPYIGLPIVVYGVGDDDYTIPHVIKFEYTDEAIYSKVYTNTTKTAQSIFKERFKPTTFSLQFISQIDDIRDDYIARTSGKDISVTIYKGNVAHYIVLDLTNIRIESFEQSGEAYDGYYISTLSGSAESLSGSYYHPNATHATHYLGETS